MKRKVPPFKGAPVQLAPSLPGGRREAWIKPHRRFWLYWWKVLRKEAELASTLIVKRKRGRRYAIFTFDIAPKKKPPAEVVAFRRKRKHSRSRQGESAFDGRRRGAVVLNMLWRVTPAWWVKGVWWDVKEVMKRLKKGIVPKEAVGKANPIIPRPVAHAVWASLMALKASSQWPVVLARAAPMTPAQGADEDGAGAPVNRPLGRGGGQTAPSSNNSLIFSTNRFTSSTARLTPSGGICPS
jgi:hypothetical protein